ncbi:hypothetical protein Zmor_025013 [Zophobas morio]|uniref:Uncharacterized protein n=1 Tax=Zophobas morio TaxID=2755281 RepID=A0AA38HQQ6_9CUCU|nr:hypothetical protein Zmor_025013 [Zophobas morio]
MSAESRHQGPYSGRTYLPGVGGLEVGLEGHVGEGHFHGVLDRVQELDHHVRDVLEAELAPLSRTKGRPDLQRVEQEWLEEIHRKGRKGRLVTRVRDKRGLTTGAKLRRMSANYATAGLLNCDGQFAVRGSNELLCQGVIRKSGEEVERSSPEDLFDPQTRAHSG